MGENIQKQLNEYLKSVDCVVKDALERFESLYPLYGEISLDFINDIKEITINRYFLLIKWLYTIDFKILVLFQYNPSM